MEEIFLTPIEINKPPHHTLIKPRCYTCSKFPVCQLRTDYLKTAYLIQQILGEPQEDRELGYYNSSWGRIPGYKGYDFEQPEDYFPQQVQTSDGKEGTFKEAKYRNKDIVQFFYIIEGYFVLFSGLYNESSEQFDISEGKEIYYGIEFSLSPESIQQLSSNLITWRQEMIQKEEEAKDLDVINTTYFSAKLECDFYEQEKGLTEKEGIERLFAFYPEGIPCKNGRYIHLSTYHIEKNKIPPYYPYKGKIAFAPMPYPVFIPPKQKKNSSPPCRRGDFNE